jgi:anthranilate phosphoribosyltransferase
LSGTQTGSAKDIVVLNASAAIIAGGLAEDFVSAVKLAEASISDGEAQNCLNKLIEVSNKV